jgi:hypothetical protein
MKTRAEIRLLQIKLADTMEKIKFTDGVLTELWLTLLDTRERLAIATQDDDGTEENGQ